MRYFAPPVELHGNTDQQIADIYTYLFKLANQLNLQFEETTPAAIFAEVNKALEHADSGQETNKAIVDNYQQIKALVIKTADYTASSGNSASMEFDGRYVAQSEFGTYKEETNAAITANSTGIEQMYEYSASLGFLSDYDDVDITEIETWEQAYIKSGLLYYDGAEPKYGVAVGNVGTLVTVDGHKVINRQNLLSTFTADELAFWQSGNKVAYLRSGAMYFPSAHISGGSIEIGGSESGGQHVQGPFYVDTSGNMTASSATISGQLTAQSGSKLGNWDVNTAIYNGKTSLTDTSHSGIYIGTDGLYIGDGASTETFVKLLPDGSLTANSATITGTLHAGSGSSICDWTISKTTGTNPISRIYSGSRSSIDSTASGVYIGTDGISMGTPLSGTSGFKITSSGALTCRGATIKGNITADSLSLGSGVYIDGSNITSNSITATQIKAATITANEIAGQTITAAELASGCITTAKLDAGCVTAAKLAAMSITADKIKLYGNMTVYTTSSGTTSGGSLGYFTGFDGQVTTAGIGLKASSGGGQVAATSGGASIRCGSSDYGEVWVTAGSVGLRSKYGTDNSIIYYGYNSTDSMFSFRPSSNGSLPLGSPSNKWAVLYASSATINTSDRQVKHDISYNIDNYEALFDELKPVKYKYDNGTSNRYHTGFISQDIEDSLKRLGMSSLDFAAFIKSPKYDDENAVVGYNYALRYEEIIALNTLKIKKLEARIAALEGA